MKADLKIGQEVYIYNINDDKKLTAVKITKIGNKYAYAGDYKLSLMKHPIHDTLYVYEIGCVCYLNKERFEYEKLYNSLLNEIYNQVYLLRTNSYFKNPFVENLKTILRLLKNEDNTI